MKMSITQAAEKNITAITKPEWPGTCHYLTIEIDDGKPGNQLRVYSPMNPVDPAVLPMVTYDLVAEDYVEYSGPTNNSPEYAAAREAYKVSMNHPITK